LHRNFQIDGFNWAINFLGHLRNPAGAANAGTYDNTSVRTSFNHNSTYLSGMQSTWQTAFNAGHELDDHAVNHPDGISFSTSQWTTEIHNCRTVLATAMGTTVGNIKGFRAPFLHYNDSTFTAPLAESPAFSYDTSIMGCSQPKVLSAGESSVTLGERGRRTAARSSGSTRTPSRSP